MEGNIRIYRLPKGHGTDQWKYYCPSWRWGKYTFHVAPVYTRFLDRSISATQSGIMKVTWIVFNQLNACFLFWYSITWFLLYNLNQGSPPSSTGDRSRFWLYWLDHLVYLLNWKKTKGSNQYSQIWLRSPVPEGGKPWFKLACTWWTLLQKYVAYTEIDIYSFMPTKFLNTGTWTIFMFILIKKIRN